MQDQATDALVAGIAHKATISGGSVAVIAGLTANDIAAFIGAAVAIIGVCIQFYYKRKADRREAELQKAQLAVLREHGQHQ